MTNTAITRYVEAPLQERHEYAQALASAGDLIPRSLFGPPIDGRPPQPSVGKVLLVIETGAMLGLHPIAALSGINVIEGKPAASAGLISGVLRASGHKLHMSESGSIEGGDYAATATLVRGDDPEHPFTSTWTPHRAARAGLCRYEADDKGVWRVTSLSKSGQPLPWQSYTESLCKARAVSEVGRDGGQDALMGVRYTPEELGGVVDANGEYRGELVEEAEPEAVKSALPAPRKRATNGTQGAKRAPAKVEEPRAASEPPAPTEPESDPNVIDAEVVSDDNSGMSNEAVAEQTEAERKARISANVAAAKAEAAAKREEEAKAAVPDPDEIDRDDANAVAEWNASHGMATGHLLTSNAEIAERDERAAFAAEQEEAARAAELTADEAAAEMNADISSGEVPDAVPTVDEIKASRAARGAPTRAEPTPVEHDPFPEDEPTAAERPFDALVAAEPEAWEKQLAAAETTADVRSVWDRASLVPGAMTTPLRLAVIARRDALKPAEG